MKKSNAMREAYGGDRMSGHYAMSPWMGLIAAIIKLAERDSVRKGPVGDDARSFLQSAYCKELREALADWRARGDQMARAMVINGG